MKERTILVNGVSKSYAMTGWRIGYSASNPQLAKVMANYLSHSTSAPSTISQQAAITALTGPQEDMQVMKQAFEQRRDHLVERMNKIEGVSCIKPEGAFYVMMNMKGFLGKTMYGKVIESAEDFAQLFLEKGLVATVPCTASPGPPPGEFFAELSGRVALCGARETCGARRGGKKEGTPAVSLPL